jgi:tetratricopeptide (TPR) repeat protein
MQSLFPRGVKVELLGWIVQAGGEVAGALVGLVDCEVVRLLDRLKALGLVFRSETDRQSAYSAHPFLREFFRNLLGTKPESVHESVRSKLAPGLEAQPYNSPRNPAILDQYELLIEETFLAGHVQEAFDLYWNGLGGYRNLGWALGDHARGLRVLERFAPRDNFSLIEPHVPWSMLTNDLGLFAKGLGDSARARAALTYCLSLNAGNNGDPRHGSFIAENLAELELVAGRFPRAREHSESAFSLATEAKDESQIRSSVAWRAASHCAGGDMSAALADFDRATHQGRRMLYSVCGVLEAECRLLRGDRIGALSRMHANREACVRNDWNDDLCRCNALLARLVLPDDSTQAADHLQRTRAFADHSGDIERRLRCFQAACELQRHLGDYPQSIAEGEAGILLADTCGFGKYSIDLRLALAETHLAAGDAHKALQTARDALDRSEQPDCQYAWGKADGLHWCGMAHLRLGERELAIQRLTAALEIRERLGHGRIEETRHALDLCRP